MMLGWLFLMAVLALILPGEVILRMAAPGVRWGWYRPWVAFGIGQGVATSCLWCLGMIGVPMWTWGIGIVLMVSIALLWKSCRHASLTATSEDVSTWHAIARWAKSQRLEQIQNCGSLTSWRRLGCKAVTWLPWCILLLATWVLCMQVIDEALMTRIVGIPGMGNWAYKTKLLMMTEVWPSDYFDYEGHNRRMGYPPGFPLLSGWCAAWMGGLDTHAIRLLSVLLVVGTFLLAGAEMIRRRRWWGIPSVLAMLALFLSYTGREICARFYAEPLLMYTAAVTIVVLARAPKHPGCMVVGMIAAGCMAWTKNEGVVGFFLLAACLFLFAKSMGSSRKAVVMAACGVACVMIAPWRVYLFMHDWSDESFAWESFVGAGRWERLAGAWAEYAEPMFQRGDLMGGAWWLLPILACLAWRRDGGVMARMLIMVAVGWIMVAMVMMMGSAEDDFAWHVRAAPRVLLCPSLLLLMGYAYLGVHEPSKHDEV